MSSNKKKLIPIIIPVIIAICVMIGLSISGHLTNNKDTISPTAQQTTESTTQGTTLPADSKVSIIAVGDNLIHDTLIESGKQSDGSYNYDKFYENISQYAKSADIAVMNQETILGGESFDYSGYPCFNSPWEVGEAAINAGFNVFTCATNHALDVSKDKGINKELEFYSKHPEVTHLGTNASEDDYNKITYLEKNDIKFALLNYTYGTNGISLPDDKPWVVNMMDKDKITTDVKEAKKNADVVIVFPHWGTEGSNSVSDYQKEYTKLFSDLGVDIVIGTHPHVLQPVEWVTNEDSGKKMLVYYSLGNLVSHQRTISQFLGGMAEITVERVDGEITVTNAKLAPTFTQIENKSSGSGYNFTVYKLSDYTDELASKHHQVNTSVSELKQTAKDVIDEQFLDM